MKECWHCSSKEDSARAREEGEPKTIARKRNGVLERFPNEPLHHDDEQDCKDHEDLANEQLRPWSSMSDHERVPKFRSLVFVSGPPFVLLSSPPEWKPRDLSDTT